MVFNGDLTVNEFIVNHVVIKMSVVVVILLRLDHFCLGFGNSEIV